MKNKNVIIIAVALIIGLICICVAAGGIIAAILSTSTGQPVAEVAERGDINTVAPAKATLTIAPTNISIPTDTPFPTNTLIPTTTPGPTATPSPTFTPSATATSTEPPPPTPTPTFPPDFPVGFFGPGDKVLNISLWEPGVMAIIAAQAEDNFIVQSYDQNGELVDLIVNKIIGTYAGFRPINWPDDDNATMLQVEANKIGEWTIAYLPIYSDQITTVSVPGSYSGASDNVIRVNGFTAGTVSFTSQGSENFIVLAYNQNLEYLDLLVNEIGAYSGTVILPPETAFLVVEATGNWSMDIAGN